MRQSANRWASIAETTSAFIATNGENVTLHDGVTVKKAIVEQRAAEVERNTPTSMLDGLRGRPVIFFFAAADAALIGAGDILHFGGERFRVHPDRTIGGGNTSLGVGIFATTGAV